MAKKTEIKDKIELKDKLSNDEKSDRYKKRKILFYLIIVFGFTTIILSVASLVIKISPIFAVISFVIETILSKYRDKLRFKDE